MNESGAEYPLFFSAVSYSFFAVLKISLLDELCDSRLLIEVGPSCRWPDDHKNVKLSVANLSFFFCVYLIYHALS